jgi:hypothetical protein
MTKSDKIREYFRKHPDADVAKVAAKFEASKPMTYKMRGQVAAEWQPPAVVPVPEAVTKSALEVQVAGDHYRKMKIQPVEYIHKNGIPFIEGCIIKYASRWRDKGGIKDLEKIKHFADLLIELEGVER